MPQELMEFGQNVEEIYQKETDLESLPEDIESLENLQGLHLYGNKLESLPNSLSK